VQLNVFYQCDACITCDFSCAGTLQRRWQACTQVIMTAYLYIASASQPQCAATATPTERAQVITSDANTSFNPMPIHDCSSQSLFVLWHCKQRRCHAMKDKALMIRGARCCSAYCVMLLNNSILTHSRTFRGGESITCIAHAQYIDRGRKTVCCQQHI
jgi:hypothetical protein